MSVYPEAIFPATAATEARLVVLRRREGGILSLGLDRESKPELPPVNHGGDCFPISIYCRSPTEAIRVWQILQPIAEVMDGQTNDDVAVAFLTNVVVARMFGQDESAEFYATFFGLHRRPVLFLCWADARIHISRYSGDLNIQRAKTFIDGLIHLCVGPRPDPSILLPIEYVRPTVRGIVRPVGVVCSGGDGSQPVEAMDSSEDDSSSDSDGSTAPFVPTLPNRSLIPGWVMDVLAERLQDSDRPITVLYRSRDIEANSIRSFRRPHRATAIVPSLGSVADQILDGLGYPSSAIPLLHMAYINALRSRGQRSMFVHVMANRGMSLMEAAMFWNLIELPGGMSFDYRVRIDIPQD